MFEGRLGKSCNHGISIVTIYANNMTSLYYFLRSVERSTHVGEIEIIVVDDASGLRCDAMIESFNSDWCRTTPGLSARLVRNSSNLGNCHSRNVGISHASHDHLFIVDSDCPISSDLLEAHHEAICVFDFEVVIGSRGIETDGRHPIDYIRHLEDSDRDWISKSRWQEPSDLGSFLNFVTRNVSVTRSVLDGLDQSPFDEEFSYSRSADSGFGWEDVDLGCRLYEHGARFAFEPRGFTVHVSHSSKTGDEGKGLRSFVNFNSLVQKHDWLPEFQPSWTASTFEAIDRWVKRDETVSPEAGASIERLHRRVTQASAVVPRQLNRRLRILTHRWHVPHQHELHRLDADFFLVKGFDGFSGRWGWDERPPHSNVRWIDQTDVVPEEFDLAIGHFDENVVSGAHKPSVLADDWGAVFWWIVELGIPTIAVCHGTPPVYFADASKVESGALAVEALKRRLTDVLVVLNSHQAESEWSFARSRTIWHGMAAGDFPPPEFGPRRASGWTLPSQAFSRRPEYNGEQFYREVRASTPWVEPFERTPLFKSADPNYLGTRANYLSYLRRLGSRAVYFNPTQFSPMPRTRTEAMWLSAVSVSARSHDVDMFIESGRNGFIFDTTAEAVDILNYLARNPMELDRLSRESRSTAARIFNVDRFLADWRSLLADEVA